MKRFLGCLGVFLIFLFGVFIGGVVVSNISKEQMYRWFMAGAPGGPEHALDLAAKRLRRELKLTGPQQKTFDEIVTDTRARLGEVQRKAQPEVNATLRDAEARVRAILNPEQTKKFDEIIHRGKKQPAASPTPAATPASF